LFTKKEKKGSSDITKKKQNRLFAKKNIPHRPKKNLRGSQFKIPTEALLKCISIIKCIKLAG